MRAGRGAQRQAEAAAFEIDAALVTAGLGQRHERGAVERVLARALVSQPGLRQHELALDDLADLHAGELRARSRSRGRRRSAPRRARVPRARRAKACHSQRPPAGCPVSGGWPPSASPSIAAARRSDVRVRLAARARRPAAPPSPTSPSGSDERRTPRRARAARRSSREPRCCAEREAAVPLHPHRDRHREAAMQERAGDVAELGRRQVTRKRCSERIIKALGRRAGRVHEPQCSHLPSYTLALL